MVAAVGAVFWGFFFFGLIDLVTPFVEGEDFAAHYLMETGWGLTFLVLVAVPLLMLVVRPGAEVALLELTLVGVALAVGAVLAGSAEHLLPGVGVLLTAGLLAGLGGLPRPARPVRVARVTALVATVAAIPAAAYAWRMARATENPEETWGLDHYPVQAGFAIAVVLVASLAAYATVSDRSLRWLPALTAALSAIWMGALSLTWPERLGSLGTAWALVAIAWGVALLTSVAIEGRTDAGGTGPGDPGLRESTTT